MASERAPFLGRGRPPGGGRSVPVLSVAAGLAALLALVALSASMRRASLLQLHGQVLVLGDAYPYVRTPYADSYRPYGYQAPAQYPVYPYENGQSYSNEQPYYEAYGKDQSKTYHEWFPDDYNVGTGPLSPLWTAMAGKQQRVQEAVLGQRMGPGLARAMTLEAVDHAPTRAVGGGQYYSPILPSEDEAPAWSLFGDNWADHTYEPSVNPRARTSAGHGARLLETSVRSKEANMEDDRGFQQLAHADWHTRGHSNNYMGMEAPVRNLNALGDHQVGFTDREYNASGVDAEEQNHVVDNALRSMWDVFAGNEDVASFEPPKMGFSLDNNILCEEEEDPALCAEHPAVGRPVSEVHTNPQWIPYPTNVHLDQGVLATDQRGAERGVLPAGGGVRTFHGRRGDLVKDCTDPAACHLQSGTSNGPVFPAVPPYGLSRIPDGQSMGVDMQPLFTRPPLAVNLTQGPDPDWLKELRNVSGYSGP